MTISTDDLKDLPHLVIIKTDSGFQMKEFEGEGCMERAHEFAETIGTERSDAVVLVAMHYRKITGPDARHLG
ncbi:hypothetical protein PTW32_01710 [Dechloromonas agitata]|uniref:hypothetical protein n=1 Tax=Dechloromonas agitata TaxID=73030 RepID=UPI00237E0E77|nr:hypothetical protein [Dechloromonas agitata]MBT9571431.1 hypothetical protein [Pseudomonas umsongensis]MDE1544118.1 hypothetical protein [Dechloromonas agitata]